MSKTHETPTSESTRLYDNRLVESCVRLTKDAAKGGTGLPAGGVFSEC